MGLREETSFCRICPGGCGVRMQIDDTGTVVEVHGDKLQPISKGYACFKGLQIEESHHGPARLLHPLKRQPDGTFTRIGLEQALDEIALKFQAIIARDGAEAFGIFVGGGATMTATANAMHAPFMQAAGSTLLYSTLTIDQSAKVVAAERLGGWAAGVQGFDSSEVLMFFGTNPLVSHSAIGALTADPVRRMKQARAKGLKLIVIDPRNTETARNADVFLQPLPGQDAAIAAGLVRVILSEGWHDKAFCQKHLLENGLSDLRAAVDPFTEDLVEERAGLEPGQLRAAARLFARDCRTGGAYAATGPAMSANSNVAIHLIECLNVVCGRYRRAGDRAAVPAIGPVRPIHAEVVPPARSWTAVPQSRVRGVGRLAGERLSGTLAEEILTPGEGQIRAFIVDGGNLATAMPDQLRMVEALRSLELLVTIDPYMTATARLSNYVLAPVMQYERADLPLNQRGAYYFPDGWAQYASPVLERPAGSDLTENWYVYWALANRLGLSIVYDGKTPLDMRSAPSTDELIEIILDGTRVSLDELKRHPSGFLLDVSGVLVEEGRPEALAKFDVMPADVAGELRQAFALAWKPGEIISNGKRFSHLLASRRVRDTLNSVGTQLRSVLARSPGNAARMNPGDMSALGLEAGYRIEIESDHGSVTATVKGDETLREGVISLVHDWGSLPGEDDADAGICVNQLISSVQDVEAVNAMPRMSAIPVNIRVLPRVE